MSVIALFGGTFNPFHIGHYEILCSLCEKEWIDNVFIMPDNLPPHKNCDFLASDEDRINMCKLASEDFRKSQVCLIEFEREGKSYSIDTVISLKKRYPDDEFYFVCGADMISTLDKWNSWSRLINEVNFIAFSREGYDQFEFHVDRMRNLGAKITVMTEKITEISSSELRKNLSKDMIPKKIYQYLVSRKIYNE